MSEPNTDQDSANRKRSRTPMIQNNQQLRPSQQISRMSKVNKLKPTSGVTQPKEVLSPRKSPALISHRNIEFLGKPQTIVEELDDDDENGDVLEEFNQEQDEQEEPQNEESDQFDVDEEEDPSGPNRTISRIDRRFLDCQRKQPTAEQADYLAPRLVNSQRRLLAAPHCSIHRRQCLHQQHLHHQHHPTDHCHLNHMHRHHHQHHLMQNHRQRRLSSQTAHTNPPPEQQMQTSRRRTDLEQPSDQRNLKFCLNRADGGRNKAKSGFLLVECRNANKENRFENYEKLHVSKRNLFSNQLLCNLNGSQFDQAKQVNSSSLSIDCNNANSALNSDDSAQQTKKKTTVKFVSQLYFLIHLSAIISLLLHHKNLVSNERKQQAIHLHHQQTRFQQHNSTSPMPNDAGDFSMLLANELPTGQLDNTDQQHHHHHHQATGKQIRSIWPTGNNKTSWSPQIFSTSKQKSTHSEDILVRLVGQFHAKCALQYFLCYLLSSSITILIGLWLVRSLGSVGGLWGCRGSKRPASLQTADVVLMAQCSSISSGNYGNLANKNNNHKVRQDCTPVLIGSISLGLIQLIVIGLEIANNVDWLSLGTATNQPPVASPKSVHQFHQLPLYLPFLQFLFVSLLMQLILARVARNRRFEMVDVGAGSGGGGHSFANGTTMATKNPLAGEQKEQRRPMKMNGNKKSGSFEELLRNQLILIEQNNNNNNKSHSLPVTVLHQQQPQLFQTRNSRQAAESSNSINESLQNIALAHLLVTHILLWLIRLNSISLFQVDERQLVFIPLAPIGSRLPTLPLGDTQFQDTFQSNGQVKQQQKKKTDSFNQLVDSAKQFDATPATTTTATTNRTELENLLRRKLPPTKHLIEQTTTTTGRPQQQSTTGHAVLASSSDEARPVAGPTNDSPVLPNVNKDHKSTSTLAPTILKSSGDSNRGHRSTASTNLDSTNYTTTAPTKFLDSAGEMVDLNKQLQKIIEPIELSQNNLIGGELGNKTSKQRHFKDELNGHPMAGNSSLPVLKLSSNTTRTNATIADKKSSGQIPLQQPNVSANLFKLSLPKRMTAFRQGRPSQRQPSFALNNGNQTTSTTSSTTVAPPISPTTTRNPFGRTTSTATNRRTPPPAPSTTPQSIARATGTSSPRDELLDDNQHKQRSQPASSSTTTTSPESPKHKVRVSISQAENDTENEPEEQPDLTAVIKLNDNNSNSTKSVSIRRGPVNISRPFPSVDPIDDKYWQPANSASESKQTDHSNRMIVRVRPSEPKQSNSNEYDTDEDDQNVIDSGDSAATVDDDDDVDLESLLPPVPDFNETQDGGATELVGSRFPFTPLLIEHTFERRNTRKARRLALTRKPAENSTKLDSLIVESPFVFDEAASSSNASVSPAPHESRSQVGPTSLDKTTREALTMAHPQHQQQQHHHHHGQQQPPTFADFLLPLVQQYHILILTILFNMWLDHMQTTTTTTGDHHDKKQLSSMGRPKQSNDQQVHLLNRKLLFERRKKFETNLSPTFGSSGGRDANNEFLAAANEHTLAHSTPTSSSQLSSPSGAASDDGDLTEQQNNCESSIISHDSSTKQLMAMASGGDQQQRRSRNQVFKRKSNESLAAAMAAFNQRQIGATKLLQRSGRVDQLDYDDDAHEGEEEDKLPDGESNSICSVFFGLIVISGSLIVILIGIDLLSLLAQCLTQLISILVCLIGLLLLWRLNLLERKRANQRDTVARLDLIYDNKARQREQLARAARSRRRRISHQSKGQTCFASNDRNFFHYLFLLAAYYCGISMALNLGQQHSLQQLFPPQVVQFIQRQLTKLMAPHENDYDSPGAFFAADNQMLRPTPIGSPATNEPHHLVNFQQLFYASLALKGLCLVVQVTLQTVLIKCSVNWPLALAELRQIYTFLMFANLSVWALEICDHQQQLANQSQFGGINSNNGTSFASQQAQPTKATPFDSELVTLSGFTEFSNSVVTLSHLYHGLVFMQH